jgi:alanyl-tRNA synthetase
MGTQRLYYDDAFLREFTGQVLSCELEAVETDDPAGKLLWDVRLNRSAFYPASGGQPHDLGEFLPGAAKVVEVRDEGGEIVHVVDQRVEVGEVTGRIDWDRRFDHMQQHTGQHLLSAVFQRNFSLATISFHLGAELCTIDLRAADTGGAQLPGGEGAEGILAEAAAAANEAIYEDRAVRVIYGTAEELAHAGVRKEVKREGLLRAIAIEGMDLQPCGGTHLRSTGQIGMISLLGLSKIRGEWRVEFVCGRRAARMAREDFTALKAVARKLNCAVKEVEETAERVVAERDAHYKSARSSLQRLAAMDAAAAVAGLAHDGDATSRGIEGEKGLRVTMVGDVRVVTRLFQDERAEYVQLFASEVAKVERSVALVARSACGHVFFMQHAAAGKDMNALLQAGMKKLGGKGGGSRDSARGRLNDGSAAGALLELVVRGLEGTRSKTMEE